MEQQLTKLGMVSEDAPRIKKDLESNLICDIFEVDAEPIEEDFQSMSCAQIEIRVKAQSKAQDYVNQLKLSTKHDEDNVFLKRQKVSGVSTEQLVKDIEQLFEDRDESRLTFRDIDSKMKTKSYYDDLKNGMITTAL